MQSKQCNTCGDIKPLTEFYRDKGHTDGFMNMCKACNIIRSKKWKKENRDKVIQRKREWNAKNPGKIKNWNSSRGYKRYGITEKDYYDMFEAQGGVCAICGKKDLRGCINDTLVIDHDHETGRVRGLLCGKCNSALGFLGDSIEILQRAIEYLKEP